MLKVVDKISEGHLYINSDSVNRISTMKMNSLTSFNVNTPDFNFCEDWPQSIKYFHVEKLIMFLFGRLSNFYKN